jgi:peptidoglycan/LPS O-acetylase OafA/YrhL
LSYSRSDAGGIDAGDRCLSLGQTFDPRHNALNLLRLFFALLVILSHSIILGGYRSEVLWGHTTLGDIAVDGFFALSGFLIAASALRNNVVRYLWQRFLRIFPAFWVCLLITAVVAAPIGWLARGKSLRSYWAADAGPGHYITANFLLKMREYAIAGTPTHVPYPLAWDGSLWTLWYEFLCYLVVAALAVTTLLRRRRVVLALWAVSWVLALGLAVSGVLTTLLPHSEALRSLVRFIPIFFAGAVLWLYRDKIPDSRVFFVVALLLFVAGTFLKNPDVLGPMLAYVCVWASIHLPGKRIGAKYDISYGTYIYAFLVAQVLAIWHAYRWGYFPFTLLTTVVTLVLAGLSCVLIEQPALRFKHWSPPLPAERKAGRHRGHSYPYTPAAPTVIQSNEPANPELERPAT